MYQDAIRRGILHGPNIRRTEIKKALFRKRVVACPQRRRDSSLGTLAEAFDSKVTPKRKLDVNQTRELGTDRCLSLPIVLEENDTAPLIVLRDNQRSMEFILFLLFSQIY